MIAAQQHQLAALPVLFYCFTRNLFFFWEKYVGTSG